MFALLYEMFAPLKLSKEAPWDRIFAQIEVEENGDADEESKKYDLDKMANDDNALASLHAVKASATLNAATWMQGQHNSFSTLVEFFSTILTSTL